MITQTLHFGGNGLPTDRTLGTAVGLNRQLFDTDEHAIGTLEHGALNLKACLGCIDGYGIAILAAYD